MKPTVTFADARLATLTILRDRAPEATYGTKEFGDIAPKDRPGLPYVMVAEDGTDVRYPVTATATVRLTVWDETEAAAVTLAKRLYAVLLTHGGAEIRSFGDGTGPTPASDPRTGEPLATFTVEARLRPIPF